MVRDSTRPEGNCLGGRRRRSSTGWMAFMPVRGLQGRHPLSLQRPYEETEGRIGLAQGNHPHARRDFRNGTGRFPGRLRDIRLRRERRREAGQPAPPVGGDIEDDVAGRELPRIGAHGTMVAAQRFHSGAIGIHGIEFAIALEENAAVAQHVLCHVAARHERQPQRPFAARVRDFHIRPVGRSLRVRDATVRNI